jgi:TPR repeat protein
MISGKNTVVAGDKHKNPEAIAKDKFTQAAALEEEIASLPRPSLEILETIKNLFKEAADLKHPGAMQRFEAAQSHCAAEETQLLIDMTAPPKESVAPVVLMKPIAESIADLKVKIAATQKKVENGEATFESLDSLTNELKRLASLSTGAKISALKTNQQRPADAMADFKKGKYIEDNKIGLNYKKDAFDLYEKSANAKPNGYPPAQYYLAVCYQLGYGTDKDIKKAIPLLSLAAKNNQPNAQFTLASFYLGSEGIQRDEKAAASLYAQASAQGHPKATNQLGLLTLLEHGTALTGEKAKQAAVNLFKKSATLASQPLKYESLYELSALNASSASATFNFAWCLEHGIGIEKNLQHALTIYHALADQADYMAMYALDKHEPKRNWLHQAAIAGAARHIDHPEGFHHLLEGIRLENGYSVPKDADEALKNYQAAFKYGFNDAALYFEALTDRLKLAARNPDAMLVSKSDQSDAYVYLQPVATAHPPKSDKPTANPGGSITAGLVWRDAEEMEDLEEEHEQELLDQQSSAKAAAKANAKDSDAELLSGYEVVGMFQRRQSPSLLSHGYEQFNVMATAAANKAKSVKIDAQSNLITLSSPRIEEVGNEILDGMNGDAKRNIKPKPYKKLSFAGTEFKSIESLTAMVNLLTKEKSLIKQKIVEVDFAESLNKISEVDKMNQLKRLGHLKTVIVSGAVLKVDAEPSLAELALEHPQHFRY